MPKQTPANKPETYLRPDERAMVNRLLGFPEEFPQKFIAWIDDHLRVNVPQFPVTHVRGFQDFSTTVQQFILGEGATWPFISGKGDLIVGVAPQTVTILPVGASPDGYVLVVDDAEQSGLKWASPASVAADGKRELAVVFTAPSQAVSSNTAMSIGITNLLADCEEITDIRAFVTTVGSTDTVITVGSGVTDDPVTIQNGDNWDDSTFSFNDPSVSLENIIPITVTSAGSGAKGLTVIITLG